jgi:hypothetical protein
VTAVGLRRIELTRGAFGLALLCAPRWSLRNLHDIEVDTKSIAVARILGARQLAQAGLSGVNPSPEVLALGVWVDVAHGTTAAAVALLDRDRASAGLLNLATAGVWAAWGGVDLRRGPAMRPGGHERLRDRLAHWSLTRLPAGPSLLRPAEQGSR